MADKQDDVSIESIKVKLGGETKTLTLEQAKKLRDALNAMFGTTYAQQYAPICLRPHADEWHRGWWQIHPWASYCSASSGDASTSFEAVNAPQAMCLSVDLDAK